MKKELSAFSMTSQRTTFSGGVRTIVSKQKRRFVDGDFDLDLSYITPRIIAMGYPSSGVEGMYRNPRDEVKRFFSQRHGGHYKVYNLCSERSYTKEDSQFEDVEIFPFDDHNPCALQMLELFCENVHDFLSRNPENVVAIHCKAGKGRTGLAVVSYLLYAGIEVTTEEALEKYAKNRTSDGKGVTIPSQIRYVYYFERLLSTEDNVICSTYQISHVRVATIPKWKSNVTGGGCMPYLKIKTMTHSVADRYKWKIKTVFNQKEKVVTHDMRLRRYYLNEEFIDIPLSEYDIQVSGDVNISLFDKSVASDDNICQVWFHTAFIEKNYLVFEKSVVDRARNDRSNKYFDPKFRIEVYLHRVEVDLTNNSAAVHLNDDNKSQISEVDHCSSIDSNLWEVRSELQMSEVADPQELSQVNMDLSSDLGYSDVGGSHASGSSGEASLKSDMEELPYDNSAPDIPAVDSSSLTPITTEGKDLFSRAKMNLLRPPVAKKHSTRLQVTIPHEDHNVTVNKGNEEVSEGWRTNATNRRVPPPPLASEGYNSELFANARNMLLQASQSSSPASTSSQIGTAFTRNPWANQPFTPPSTTTTTTLPLSIESLRKFDMMTSPTRRQQQQQQQQQAKAAVSSAVMKFLSIDPDSDYSPSSGGIAEFSPEPSRSSVLWKPSHPSDAKKLTANESFLEDEEDAR